MRASAAQEVDGATSARPPRTTNASVRPIASRIPPGSPTLTASVSNTGPTRNAASERSSSTSAKVGPSFVDGTLKPARNRPGATPAPAPNPSRTPAIGTTLPAEVGVGATSSNVAATATLTSPESARTGVHFVGSTRLKIQAARTIPATWLERRAPTASGPWCSTMSSWTSINSTSVVNAAPTSIAPAVPTTGSVLVMGRTGMSGSRLRYWLTTSTRRIASPAATGTRNGAEANPPRESQATPKNGSTVAPIASGIASQSKSMPRRGASSCSNASRPTTAPTAPKAPAARKTIRQASSSPASPPSTGPRVTIPNSPRFT